MKKTSLVNGVFVALVWGSTLASAPALAHITMTGALSARGGDQKAFPCDGARGDGPIYTFEPGATITLALSELIPHPSYFRIAFDDQGDDDFKEPQSIDPIDPHRDPSGKCIAGNALDHCGASDFCNAVSAKGPTVLWDNLNPHLTKLGATWSWNVKLPDVECDDCTIQILQVMEDSNLHGPYCVEGNDCTHDTSAADIYHRCIDIKLVKGAANGPGVTTAAVDNDGILCAANEPPASQVGDAGAEPTDDPQTMSGATAVDAGTPSSSVRDAASEDVETANSTGKKDAGKTSSSADAGKSSVSDVESPPDGDGGGCAVVVGGMSDRLGSLASMLSLLAFLARRKRHSRA